MNVLYFVALGLGIGTLSGILGIGGGILLVPGLMWLGIDDQRRAAAISLAVLTPPIVLPAVWRYYVGGYLSNPDLALACIVAVAFALGSYGGAEIVARDFLPLSTLRLLFGLLLLLVAVRFLLLSSPAVASAFYGLLACGLAWLSYLALRALGRHHAPRPSLGEKIRGVHDRVYQGSDYSI